jgi:hypothetical protein
MASLYLIMLFIIVFFTKYCVLFVFAQRKRLNETRYFKFFFYTCGILSSISIALYEIVFTDEPIDIDSIIFHVNFPKGIFGRMFYEEQK